MKLSPEVDAAIDRAAARHGLDPTMLRTFVRIESGGNPRLVNKYGYSGVLQLSPQEFARHGGSGDILDLDANLSAGAAKLRAEAAEFAKRHGREPSSADLYLVHQQGAGGSAAHMANPDRPAWQNMLSTGEGRQKGEGWARRAIWDNVPDDVKAKHGSVDNLTSRQFVEMWNDKVARIGGADAPKKPQGEPLTEIAAGPPPIQPQPSEAGSSPQSESASSGFVPTVASVLGVPGELSVSGIDLGSRSPFGLMADAAEPEQSPFASAPVRRRAINPARLRAAVAARRGVA